MLESKVLFIMQYSIGDWRFSRQKCRRRAKTRDHISRQMASRRISCLVIKSPLFFSSASNPTTPQAIYPFRKLFNDVRRPEDILIIHAHVAPEADIGPHRRVHPITNKNSMKKEEEIRCFASAEEQKKPDGSPKM